MPVSIVTDSTCDLTSAQAQAMGLEMVPIIVRLGDREYHDGVDLRLSDFYTKLDPNGELPVTVPPPPDDFAALFSKHVQAGNEVVCITVASKLSKTFEHAQQAAAQFGGKVHLVDSKTLSGGIGLIASGAARLAKTGMDAQTIVAAAKRWIGTQHGYAIYPDLKFLAKSGRINKAQLVLGTVMHLVPITRVGTDGTLEPETTVKSWDQAKQMLASIMSRRLERPTASRVAITHTHAPELGQTIAEELKKRLIGPLKEISVWEAGPTIAANAGPGAAAIFMLEE
ncbi:MAG TPA: DegV family protein [Candidatus Baltobacteraceae bacterium]|nr:DegV family protein [Candidatus Baltobacteraceae bacterium]